MQRRPSYIGWNGMGDEARAALMPCRCLGHCLLMCWAICRRITTTAMSTATDGIFWQALVRRAQVVKENENIQRHNKSLLALSDRNFIAQS
jgi:hypothetical protein